MKTHRVKQEIETDFQIDELLESQKGLQKGKVTKPVEETHTVDAPDFSTQDLLLKAELALTLLKKTQNHIEYTGFDDETSEFM